MQSKNTLLVPLLVTVSIFSVIFATSVFNHLKKTELDFNEKKGELIKENLDLKDRLESLQEVLRQRTAEVAGFEEKKKTLEVTIAELKAENEKLQLEYTQLNTSYNKLIIEKKALEMESEDLKEKFSLLSKRVEELEKSPLVQKIKETAQKESNSEIKKVLEMALHNIELIQSGKPVELSPIVVVGKDATQPTRAAEAFKAAQKSGRIVSVDSKNNLVVINLGRDNDVKEGDGCSVLGENTEELAQGEVISVRFDIAAVFIRQITYQNTMSNIREGLKVIVYRGP